MQEKGKSSGSIEKLAAVERNADVMHIPAFSLDGINGLSPLQYGAVVIGSAISADEAASGTFKNGLMPTVAFSVDRVLKKEQREAFRVCRKRFWCMNAGKGHQVARTGVDAKTIGIDPADAQLLESRGWSVEEICRFFRVPLDGWPYRKKHQLGHRHRAANDRVFNVHACAMAEAYRAGITTTCCRRFSGKPITQSLRLEGPLLRADSAARAEFYAKMTTNGIYTRDDCRVKENLPREGGNAAKLTVQMNMTTLDKIGEQNDGQAAKAALMSWLSKSD